ncbi:hypothetical protein FJT64_013543 [Amphibalanus amphitrite]|uniref:Protein sleepless n=1 Tax=Amphibalanus amphitrite TaxID=1232801 RepID=A0A6A4VEU8_AMPAM|nr:hypothetical protein FJT64_013543 [Amphibalanus amphitrite]
MVQIVSLVTLVILGSTAAETVQKCYSCSSRTPNSRCHMKPLRKPEMSVRCDEPTAHCVTERLQTEEGTFIAIERRCSSREETKQAHNRCERSPFGIRCLTICYGSFCNFGTGQLFEENHPWDYDDPEYSDYIYDPEEAVLAGRKRPYSGPFPVGTEEFPVARRVSLEALKQGVGVAAATAAATAGAAAARCSIVAVAGLVVFLWRGV